jgi:hypothetical protein
MDCSNGLSSITGAGVEAGAGVGAGAAGAAPCAHVKLGPHVMTTAAMNTLHNPASLDLHKCIINLL